MSGRLIAAAPSSTTITLPMTALTAPGDGRHLRPAADAPAAVASARTDTAARRGSDATSGSFRIRLLTRERHSLATAPGAAQLPHDPLGNERRECHLDSAEKTGGAGPVDEQRHPGFGREVGQPAPVRGVADEQGARAGGSPGGSCLW